MKAGGKTPPMCDEKFTAYSEAQKELVKYLRRGDKIGVAVYPKKG